MKTAINITEFRELLKRAKPSDFDGHTEFNSLTPEQRLLWLSSSQQFISEVKYDSKM